MIYVVAIVVTLLAWFLGLFLDENLDFGDTKGFLCLRVLFPILAMGICILYVVVRI